MDYLQELTERYPKLKPVAPDINAAFNVIAGAFSNGGKLLIAGNGGSAADAEHIVGELMKNFVKKRRLPAPFIEAVEKADPEIAAYLLPHLQPGLPSIPLSSHASLNTASLNDIDGNIIFAQQVYGYGKPGDVFLGISTSGNSRNVLCAAATAKAKDLKVIALSGGSGGALKRFADVSVIVPEIETYKIQELHLPVYHCLCLMLEDRFF
ncbi:MAG: SIS domain-containing protein [Spirochaetaceae bacterium]|jgi:D-sedoheptulose 7-phosphate isomerase|nr:SIS domain-containing protein [Spirochaetaceae bacterium]